MNNRLVIMSAGKNSRFNSEEKIFADINGKSNIENTYELASNVFSEIYLAVDERWFKKYSKVPNGITVINTIGGKGDIYSIYHLLKNLKGIFENDIVTICWGDAVFVSDIPFKEFTSQYVDDYDTFVAVSKDRFPYAWFDVDGNFVQKAYFKKTDGTVSVGLHDQSLFGMRISSLASISEYISLPNNNEYKTLKYLEWLYSSRYKSAKYCNITKNNVKSFNTKEELERIVKC